MVLEWLQYFPPSCLCLKEIKRTTMMLKSFIVVLELSVLFHFQMNVKDLAYAAAVFYC